MSVSRRHFLLGTAGAAAGLILPSYYQRAMEFIDRRGRPLLEFVERPKIEIAAYKGMDWCELEYALAVGNPCEMPPPMSFREFAARYHPESYDDWEHYWFEEPDWDSQIDWSNSDYHFDTWLLQDSPQRNAYEALKDLDLGPQFIGDDAVGEIQLEVGHTMVSSYWNVAAADDISLSLLQERLNDLNTGIRIVTA